MFISKTKLRRVLALSLCAVFVLMCVPFSASAEGDSSDDIELRLITPQGSITVYLTYVSQLTSNKRRYNVSVTVTADLNFTAFKVDTFTLYKGPSATSGVLYSNPDLHIDCSSCSTATMSNLETITITANSSGQYAAYATTSNARMNFVPRTGWYSGWRNITDLNLDAFYGN